MVLIPTTNHSLISLNSRPSHVILRSSHSPLPPSPPLCLLHRASKTTAAPCLPHHCPFASPPPPHLAFPQPPPRLPADVHRSTHEPCRGPQSPVASRGSGGHLGMWLWKASPETAMRRLRAPGETSDLQGRQFGGEIRRRDQPPWPAAGDVRALAPFMAACSTTEHSASMANKARSGRGGFHGWC
jgi:hypothetical protein